MQTLSEIEARQQLSSGTDLLPARKVGIEVVRSADVSRRHYSGPRPGRRCAPRETGLSADDRLTLLRGQLRLLRLRAEAGLAVSPAALGRAEQLAHSLEVAA